VAGVHVNTGALQARDAVRSAQVNHAYGQPHVSVTLFMFSTAHVQAAVQLLSSHELHQLGGGILLQIRVLRIAAPAPHLESGRGLHVM